DGIRDLYVTGVQTCALPISLYYVALLAWVGCVADAYEVATWFGDDIAFRADSYEVDLAGLPMLGFMLRHVGAGSPALHRLRLARSEERRVGKERGHRAPASR